MSRSLSFTEVQTALTCQAQHAFRYTGRLTDGDALKPKAIIPRLRAGRAWGRMIAAWHAGSGTLTAYHDAIVAMEQSLAEDADRQREFGVHDAAEHEEIGHRLRHILEHYVAQEEESGTRLLVHRVEEQIELPIPSRKGGRGSSRYRFQAFVDAFTEEWRPDENWLVEYKLRDKLSPYELVANGRQIRWYAWAFQRRYGVAVHGVLVDERLSEPPSSPRLVQARRKGEGIDGMVPSHAVDQHTTPSAYLELCRVYGVPSKEATAYALAQRQWHKRHMVQFRDGELEQAGLELVSAAKLIRDLDGGEMLPIRNVRPQNCNSCSFKEICPSPDTELVDVLFERTPPKRDRPLLEVAAA